jgi:hypothetical protein
VQPCMHTLMKTLGMPCVGSCRFVPGACLRFCGSCRHSSSCHAVRATCVGNSSVCHVCRDPCASLCLCVSLRAMRVACHACRVSCMSNLLCVMCVMHVRLCCGSVRVRIKLLRVCCSCLILRVLETCVCRVLMLLYSLVCTCVLFLLRASITATAMHICSSCFL